jgi:uncharacterized protein YdeI (YjbR/CyaY-like superfamily)
MEEILFNNRSDWRAWLRKNHNKSTGIWLVLYKKKFDTEKLTYDESIEEALCFGWIDSTLKRIDEKKHMIKFTPRKKGSIWSKSNKQRVARLTKQRKMTKAGLNKIEEAKKDGSWKKLIQFEENPEIPQELLLIFKQNNDIEKNFYGMPPSHRKQYLWWIGMAKRDETKKRRIQEAAKRIAKGIRPGM